MTMSRIVSSEEIARCPMHRWDVEHYLPDHAWETCDAEARKAVKEYHIKRIGEYQAAAALLRAEADADIERFTLEERARAEARHKHDYSPEKGEGDAAH